MTLTLRTLTDSSPLPSYRKCRRRGFHVSPSSIRGPTYLDPHAMPWPWSDASFGPSSLSLSLSIPARHIFRILNSLKAQRDGAGLSFFGCFGLFNPPPPAQPAVIIINLGFLFNFGIGMMMMIIHAIKTERISFRSVQDGRRSFAQNRPVLFFFFFFRSPFSVAVLISV